ncbi:MAG: hypothetical protein WCQ21_36965, partial [Verrucomicrobiota bacterium]
MCKAAFRPANIHFQLDEQLSQHIMHLAGHAGALLLAQLFQAIPQGAQLRVMDAQVGLRLFGRGNVIGDAHHPQQPSRLVQDRKTPVPNPPHGAIRAHDAIL